MKSAAGSGTMKVLDDRLEIKFCCPACRSDLERLESAYRCVTCRTEFPVVMGIADFRLGISDQTRAEELKRLEPIVARYEKSASFRDFMAAHIRQHTQPGLVDLELDYVGPRCDRAHTRAKEGLARNVASSQQYWQPLPQLPQPVQPVYSGGPRSDLGRGLCSQKIRASLRESLHEPFPARSSGTLRSPRSFAASAASVSRSRRECFRRFLPESSEAAWALDSLSARFRS